MAIKRYFATQDTTISNAYASNLSSSASGSNMGGSDVLEIFSVYAQQSTSSIEKSRALIQFPISTIASDRTAGNIPASGSVSFYLNLYNAEHPFTLPKDFILNIHAVSQSWDEGRGLDMEEYTDLGTANWNARVSSSAGETLWVTQGGTFHTASYTAGQTMPSSSQTFSEGTENLSVDVTAFVEEWLVGTQANNGFAIYLTSSQEDGSLYRSFYTKKFFSRTSEFFFKRPNIEAKWNSSYGDDAGSFYLSSALAPASDNLNTLFLYNSIRGSLVDIPSIGTTGSILVSLYSSLGGSKTLFPAGGGVSSSGDQNATGSWYKTGIYTASFAYTGSATTVYPVWHSGSTEYHSGAAITVNSFAASNYNEDEDLIVSIVNMKPIYGSNEEARFRVFTRLKNWNPTIYTKATANIVPYIMKNGYWKLFRVVDGEEIIPFGTGSIQETKMSYDLSGSYFNFDMNQLEPDYMYGFKFAFLENGIYREQPTEFKFRVEEK